MHPVLPISQWETSVGCPACREYPVPVPGCRVCAGLGEVPGTYCELCPANDPEADCEECDGWGAVVLPSVLARMRALPTLFVEQPPLTADDRYARSDADWVRRAMQPAPGEAR